MCTVVTRAAVGASPRILAVRDELTSRAFDEPDEWWPEQPGVIGGRDRQAGGSWCVSAVASGVTALVLNRPQKRSGTPSRGVLPLAAVRHGVQWPEQVDVRQMATFTLLLVRPSGIAGWEWDGVELTRTDLTDGLHVTTPHGIDPDDARARRVAPLMTDRPWHDVLAAERPSAADDALMVRLDTEHGTYGTVFAQVIDARPGTLHVESTRTPWDAASWTSRTWTAMPDGHASPRNPSTTS